MQILKEDTQFQFTPEQLLETITGQISLLHDPEIIALPAAEKDKQAEGTERKAQIRGKRQNNSGRHT